MELNQGQLLVHDDDAMEKFRRDQGIPTDVLLERPRTNEDANTMEEEAEGQSTGSSDSSFSSVQGKKLAPIKVVAPAPAAVAPVLIESSNFEPADNLSFPFVQDAVGDESNIPLLKVVEMPSPTLRK
ncbi:hypothetical protein Acr_00g0069650 [Actinidia rufa]|uniref:Uncharacterized protein n=1 Tax=Actinidia rufa TaxID=165716 RepID=A0A7J0DSU2_9ERIC|nr:hypothetical protein Acr_00g0069650 [Actinidia rufa]